VTSSCSPARHARTTALELPGEFVERHDDTCLVPRMGDRSVAQLKACMALAREVRAWGSTPRETPPSPQCPMRVRVAKGGSSVIADPLTIANAFDPVPWDECVPTPYLVGTRRALHVDDGWFVAYSGLSNGELFWSSEDGRDKRALSGARIAGFARAPSGTVLALAIGRARLGKGGVIALERTSDERGHYGARLIASLPLEPSPVAFDDDGTLVGFAQGFVFRVNELGEVKNVHYVARNLGRVASIALGSDGVYYLGVECGVLRLVPEPSGAYREEWWSARNGASGRWAPCLDP